MAKKDMKAIEAISSAAFNHRVEEVRALLEQGVDPNSKLHGFSLLYSAVLGGGDETEVVQMLLDAGANPDGGPKGDEEVLQHAACVFPNVLRVLLDAGADLHRVNDEGRSALWYAIHHEQKECEAILREYGLDYTERELNEHEKGRRLKNQQKIVTNRIRSTRTKNAEQLAWLMSEALNVDLPKHVAKLLERGAVPNFREEDGLPSPLVWAADKGYLDVVRAAIAAGTDVDEQIYYEKSAHQGTALLFAARAGHLKIVKALVEAGADVNAPAIGQDGEGPPLLFAEKHGHKEVCDYLRPLTKEA
ncbi:MAG: ankyrin repeat domain-containing protein [Planctomycetaceae bacterium]|jgi:ankyrin repeat protein|nr:ankyrin repeat domain-containing protein [Planctomycetaceae bacterium]